MTHTDDPVTREPTVALFEVAKLIQTELLNEEGPLGYVRSHPRDKLVNMWGKGLNCAKQKRIAEV